MKRFHRKLGRHQKQATPLTKNILNKLVALFSNDIKGLSNKLFHQLGYETMRRRSEIVNFRFEDIHHFPNEHIALLLRHSKTDQFGDWKLIPISHNLYKLIKEWQRQTGLNEGKTLRRLLFDGATPRASLISASVSNIFKELQTKAKIDIAELSRHSFRVGTAMDLLDQGLSLE